VQQQAFPVQTAHKRALIKHPRWYIVTPTCCILSFYVPFSYDLCLYDPKFLLSLVMLEVIGDEFECDQMS